MGSQFAGLAAGLAVAVACWMLLGCTVDERALLLRCAEAVRREVVLVGVAVYKVFKRIGDSSAREPVSLEELSELIDVVRLGLSAGLSFDAALELYCSHRSGLLAGRMNQARMSWQMGVASRGEELERVSRDLGERTLESFAVAVDQALSLGSPLSDTLATQSREIRAAHRARVERDIERAPVKLLIPTGTLILPALLLSIVGPLLAASGML